jgi:hypothetical protein
MSDTITCPKCKYEIEVKQVLSAQLRAELSAEFDAAQQRKEIALEAKWQKEREQLQQQSEKKATEKVAVDLQDMQQQLTEAKASLKSAQDAELALRKERRQLQEDKEALELSVNRRLDEERSKIREAAKKEVLEERQFKEAEDSKLISDLRKQIEDLKRKAEQGSQQLQGEVLELSIEGQLSQLFPLDDVNPVPKGIHGGDVLHGVHDGVHGLCGSILWETKRTKNWSDGWLPKLRDDQRAAKAQYAILISAELPPTITSFGQIEGVWITNCACAPAVAAVLRHSLIQLAAANRALEGRSDKMEFLYKYLAGPECKHHIEGIVEAFVTLKEELEKEKRSTQRMWAKREKQLERAVLNTAGLYGDLQGIIGNVMPHITQLEEPALLTETSAEPNNEPGADA